MLNKIQALLFCILCALSAAARPYCDIRTFSIRDGLAANTISCLAQTDNRLMWFSTWNGLCCYDGYRFTTFRNEPGNDVLTSNRILFITPNAENDIWCCTDDHHVYLFDTHECRFVNVSALIEKKYGERIVARKTYSLPNGHTWVVSNNGGASFRIDDKKIKDGEGIEMFSVANGRLKSNSIKKVVLDDDGREWVFCDRGLMLLGGGFYRDIPFEHIGQAGGVVFLASSDGRVYTLRRGQRRLSRLAMPVGVRRINSMVSSADSTRVFFATDIGVVSCAAGSISCRVYSVQSPAQPSPEAKSIFADGKSRVWAYTGGGGVTMIDTRTGDVSLPASAPGSVMWRTESEKPFFHEDSYGTVWMVPAGGTFSYYDEAEQCFVPYVLKSDRGSAGIPTISKYMSDSEGNVWFTGIRNLYLVNFKYHYFKRTPVMPNQEVRSLLIDSRGRVWAGTANGQLAVFDRDRRLTGYVDGKGRIQPQPTDFSDRIYALREDPRGRVWVGTKGSGVFVLGPDGGVEHHVSRPADKFSLSSNDIYDIDIDNRGRVWIASFGGGLNLVDESLGAMRFINHRNLLRRYPMERFKKIRRITHTPDGTIILSTSGGLVTFSGSFAAADKIRFHTSRHVMGDTTGLMASDVMQTLVTRAGRILVVSMGGGVQQLVSPSPLADNLRFGRLPGVSPGEGLVLSVAEDSDGKIWMIRENIIDRYDLAEGELFRYGPGNIGENVELSEAKPVYDPRTDAISVAGWGGFVTFRPGDLRKSRFCPNIIFTGVLYQGENETEPILNRKLLDVPSDRRNLTVYFSAIEYSDKYLVRYAYKIDGVDTKWSYTGESNSASFNHLPAGRYKLLVRSTNSDGIWMDNVAGLDIYVHPVFWETVWAKILYVLLFCGVIRILIYIYTLRARAVMERELSDMKTRFFTDVSHRLRTPLTLIGGPVGEVLRTETLTETARRHLEMVYRNTYRMLRLVNSMLKYGKEVYIHDEDGVPRADDGGGYRIEDGDVSDATASALADSDLGVQALPDRSSAPGESRRMEKLLVVEDNDDLRAFLVGILGGDYAVLEAENGQRGLEIAEKEMPDFIITDVMMPVMDGLSMVHRIKQNKDICHIPIVVLSAKASLEDRLQGLREGIDDYITKPFSAIYLKSRVSNIIRQRQMLQQNYVAQLKPEDHRTYKLEAPQIVDADNEMMKRLLGYLEQRISDPALKIEDLAEAVNLGRSVFYGKIKSIVGMTPVDFVRHIRMQRAEELIAKSNYPFSQIAYMVGFSDPKYFGKCFKKETGMTPSEYREKAKA